jgi:ankyrin repeat protein
LACVLPSTIRDIFVMNKHLKFALYTLLTFSSALHALTPDERLLAAAEAGDLIGIAQALADGANIEAKTHNGLTPLHLLATHDNHLDALAFLLAHDANIEARCKEGKTPLHVAAYMGNVDALDLLLAHGANIEAQDNFSGIPRGRTPLHIAATKGYVGAINLLLTRGANIAAREKDGWTPLHLATCFDRVNAINLLLAHDAHVEAQTDNGGTPLRLAVQLLINPGQVNTIALLLAHGAGTHIPIDITQIRWWNDDLSAEEFQLIKHMITLAQTTTHAQFIALQAQHMNLKPTLDQYSDMVQTTFDNLYNEALTRTSRSLTGQAFRVIRTVARTQPKTIMPDPNDFSSFYLGDGTDLDWLHVSALAKLKARQEENQNALPSALEIAPASSLPDDFEAPKRKRDEENNTAQESSQKKNSWFLSCQIQ